MEPDEALLIRICISGRNWRACLEIDTKGLISNKDIEATGVFDEREKVLVVTGLPADLKGKTVTLKKSNTITVASDSGKRSVQKNYTLSKGSFKVSSNGELRIPYKAG